MNSKFHFRTLLILGAAAATPALANAEKFPAYDFKPSVVYRDAELINKATTGKSVTPSATPAPAHTPDPKYPAAYFTPTVIHSVLPAIPAEPTKPEHHDADPKYPAAYFNPTVIQPAK